MRTAPMLLRLHLSAWQPLQIYPIPAYLALALDVLISIQLGGLLYCPHLDGAGESEL